MTPSFAITLLDEALVLDDRRQGVVRLVVANVTDRAVTLRCRMVARAPLDAAWLPAHPAQCDLEPGGRREVEVRIAVPREAAAGVRTAHLVVWSVANPDEDYVAGPEVAITVPPPVRRFRLRLSRWVVVGLIGLVVVVASAAAAVAVQRSFATILPTRVTVPDLTGTLRADLAKELGEYLVPGTITAQATGDRPFGTVITQLPAAGTLVPPGSTVAVTVEDGVRMPKVLGQSTSAAQAAVQALPLRLAQVVPLAEASEEPLGTVVRQDPPADAVVAAGALVTLTELAAVTVPDLSGATLSEATARLAGLGLVLDPPASAKPGGRITVQNPVSGTGVRAGTKVHVLVEAPQ